MLSHIYPCVHYIWDGHSIIYKTVSAASEESDQPAHPRSMISPRCPPEDVSGPWLPTVCPENTLIRLRGCDSWSESSLSTHAIL